MMESSPYPADRADSARWFRPGPVIRLFLLSTLLATASSAWSQIGRPLAPGDDPLRDRWEFDPVRVDHELFIAANLASGDAALGISYPKSRDFPVEAPASLYRRLPETRILNGAAGRIMGTPYEQVALVTEDADGTHVDIYSGLRPGQVHIGRHDLPAICETSQQTQCRIPGPIEIAVADLDGFDLSRPDLGSGNRCLASNRRHDEVAVAYQWRSDSPTAGLQALVGQEILSWEGLQREADAETASQPTWNTRVFAHTRTLDEGQRLRLQPAQLFGERLEDGAVVARDLLLVYTVEPDPESPEFDDGLPIVAEGFRLGRELSDDCSEPSPRVTASVNFADREGIPGDGQDGDRLVEVIGGPVAADLPARDGWDVAAGNAEELLIFDSDDNQPVPATDALVTAFNAIDNEGQPDPLMGISVAIQDPISSQADLFVRTNNGFPVAEFEESTNPVELKPDSRVRLRPGLITAGDRNFVDIGARNSPACLTAGFWVQVDSTRGPLIQGLFAGDSVNSAIGSPKRENLDGDEEIAPPMWPDDNRLALNPPTAGIENIQFAGGGFLRDRDSASLSFDKQCINFSRFSGDSDTLYVARPDAAPFPANEDTRLEVVGNTFRGDDELFPTFRGFTRSVGLLTPPDHRANVGTEFVGVNMDIDGNGIVEASSDGAMLLRFLMGLRGSMVTLDETLIGSGCTRCTTAAILDYLVANADAFDADDNGLADGLSDGLLRLRFMQGAAGNDLVDGALAANCRRCDPAALVDYLRLPQDDPVVDVPVMVAFDADANSAHYQRFESGVGSIFLSEGASHVLRDIETFDIVLAEPPKHLDYLPALGGVTNVSVTSDLFATFESTQSQSQEIERETTTDFTLSESESTTRTVTAGLDLFGVAGGSVEGSVSELTTNEFNETSSNFQGESSSFSITQVSRAERDDQLVTRLNDLYIWRYPAMNIPDAQGASAGERFFEIFQPTRPLNFFSAGRVNDAYQPWHTNNNLLGYPVFTGNTFRPGVDELGRFRVGDSGTPRFEPIWNESAFTIGGLSFEQLIEFTESTSAGTSLVTSNTVTETRDTSVTASASAAGAFKGIGVSAGLSEERNWQASTSFSYAQGQFANTETDAETAISLNIPGDLAGERGYRFHPAWFFTADGGLKLTHAVALEGMGVIPETFWQTHYSTPDPALNLPFRFSLDVSTTVPDTFLLNTDATRNSVKGMFFRDGRGINPRNPSEQRGVELSFAPRAGDPVQVEVRVYNLSVGTPVENLKVRFEAQRFELGQNVGPRIPIGEARIPLIPFRGQVPPDPDQPLSELAHVRSAFTLWDTTGFGSGQADELATWKLFAVLDPDDEILDETHELVDRFDDPLLGIDGEPVDPLPGEADVFLEKGQNNTGWGLLRIAPASADDASPRAPDEDPRAFAELTVSGRGADGKASVSLDESTRLRLTLATERLTTRTRRVLVYDGRPEAGGKVIAYERVRGLDPGGIDLPIVWQPREPGRRELYLVFPDENRDGRGPAAPALTVDVR